MVFRIQCRAGLAPSLINSRRWWLKNVIFTSLVASTLHGVHTRVCVETCSIGLRDSRGRHVLLLAVSAMMALPHVQFCNKDAKPLKHVHVYTMANYLAINSCCKNTERGRISVHSVSLLLISTCCVYLEPLSGTFFIPDNCSASYLSGNIDSQYVNCVSL